MSAVVCCSTVLAVVHYVVAAYAAGAEIQRQQLMDLIVQHCSHAVSSVVS